MEGGKASLMTPAGKLEIPVHLEARVVPSGGKHSLAVRPQHIGMRRDGSGINARIHVIENLGKEAVVVLQDDARTTFRVLVAPDHGYSLGDMVYLVPDLTRAYLFNE